MFPARTTGRENNGCGFRPAQVNRAEYLDYDAHRQFGRFLDDVYVHKRIHSTLGYLTPTDLEHRSRMETQLHDRPWR